MGSGPSVHISSIHEPGALVLLSAYTSIKSVVTEKFGYLSALVQEHFDNLSIMDQIKSPTLLIHGKEDNLIACSHSVKLQQNCTNCVSEIVLPENMNHNQFEYYKHVIRPMSLFFIKLGIKTGATKRMPNILPK